MKLTIEELSKRTKLSIPTLRVYVSRQKLGTKVGNNRFFSQTDVDKLLKGSKRSTKKAGGKPAGGAKAAKTASTRKAAKAKTSRAKTTRKAVVSKPAPAPKAKTPVTNVEKPVVKPQGVKRSFWSRLFGGAKQAPKVSLMQANKS